MSAENVIRIDIDGVLRARLPRYHRFIPRCLVRCLERVVCQQELNDMLSVNAGRRDADFCRGVIEHLDITYQVHGECNLPADPRVIIVSNHPLGGLDGMILIDMVTRHYGGPVRFLVNDLLMAIEPLNGVFLPINKHGQQSRKAFQDVTDAMESDCPIIIFPAGLVSRKGKKGVVADLQWQKTFVNKAIRHRRDVIPCHFSGANSKFFYNFAKFRTRLGLKFNIEMVRLPREVFLSKGRDYAITFGKPVAWQSLRGGAEAQAQADALRAKVYGLSDNSTTEHPC